VTRWQVPMARALSHLPVVRRGIVIWHRIGWLCAGLMAQPCPRL
jgi:hypothetical protein